MREKTAIINSGTKNSAVDLDIGKVQRGNGFAQNSKV